MNIPSEIFLPDKNCLPNSDLEKYKLLRFRIYEKKIAATVRLLRENNFEPILIKGWAAALNYPKPYMRQIGDIDLAFDPSVFCEAHAFLQSCGIEEIDLHCGLRHLDVVDWKELFENSFFIKTASHEDMPIRLLRPEDHLRVLCVHWLNDGGAYREKLWDIFYAVENRPPDFDWERCLNTVSDTRRKWIVCAIGLAHKYLNLNLHGTPFADDSIEIPRWLTNAVENEWKSEIRLLPLDSCFAEKRALWQQIKKRFPPNPLQATIELEGEFDEKSRFGYQVRNMLRRFKPMVKKYAKKIFEEKS